MVGLSISAALVALRIQPCASKEGGIALYLFYSAVGVVSSLAAWIGMLLASGTTLGQALGHVSFTLTKHSGLAGTSVPAGAVIPSNLGNQTEFLEGLETLFIQNSILIPITQKSELLIGSDGIRMALISTSLVSVFAILFMVGLLSKSRLHFPTQTTPQYLFSAFVLFFWVFLAKGYVVNHAHILTTGVAVLALAIVSSLKTTLSPGPKSDEFK
jgi:hypothetical protein